MVLHMVDIRNSPPGTDVPERILIEAAGIIAAHGVRALTIAELARTAGVSRPTIYRRWPDADAIVGAVLTRSIAGILAANPPTATDPAGIARSAVNIAYQVRSDTVLGSVIDRDPDLLDRYLFTRLGTSQMLLMGALAEQIRRGQLAGLIRPGAPHTFAALILLLMQSAVLSGDTVADVLPADVAQRELHLAIERYLSA